jgi:hypothetical protein
MAWHLNLPFELHGYTKYSRETKNTFAVQDLEVAIDAEVRSTAQTSFDSIQRS